MGEVVRLENLPDELKYLQDVELDFRAREPIHPRPLSKEELDDLVEALRECIGPLKVLKEQANVSYERVKTIIQEIARDESIPEEVKGKLRWILLENLNRFEGVIFICHTVSEELLKYWVLFRGWRMWDENFSRGSRIAEGRARSQEAIRLIREFIADPEKRAELDEFLSGLTENERKVWDLRFVGGGTLDAVAAEMEITRQRVQQLAKAVQEKFKKWAEEKGLLD